MACRWISLSMIVGLSLLLPVFADQLYAAGRVQGYEQSPVDYRAEHKHKHKEEHHAKHHPKKHHHHQ